MSWKTIFLLAALIPLGQAVERTGTAAWIASGVVGASAGLSPLAANVTVGLDADPRVFETMVAIAASNSFILPTHQVNALLMGPAGYRVADYLRAGTAMSVLFLLIAAPMLLLIF